MLSALTAKLTLRAAWVPITVIFEKLTTNQRTILQIMQIGPLKSPLPKI